MESCVTFKNAIWDIEVLNEGTVYRNTVERLKKVLKLYNVLND